MVRVLPLCGIDSVHIADIGWPHYDLYMSSGYKYSFQVIKRCIIMFSLFQTLTKTLLISDGRGGTANAQDYAVCNAINEKQPFMMPIKNVSLLQGSAVQVDCNVVRQGFIAANQKVNYPIIYKCSLKLMV